MRLRVTFKKEAKSNIDLYFSTQQSLERVTEALNCENRFLLIDNNIIAVDEIAMISEVK